MPWEILDCDNPDGPGLPSVFVDENDILNTLYKNEHKRAAPRIRQNTRDYCVWKAPAQPHKVDYG